MMRITKFSWLGTFLNLESCPTRNPTKTRTIGNFTIPTTLYPPLLAGALLMTAATIAASSDPLPPDATYRPLPTLPLSEVMSRDEAMKPAVMDRQHQLLSRRYDLADQPIEGIMMSGRRKAAQGVFASSCLTANNGSRGFHRVSGTNRYVFFFGTFFPFLRAFDRPIAMACF